MLLCRFRRWFHLFAKMRVPTTSAHICRCQFPRREKETKEMYKTRERRERFPDAHTKRREQQKQEQPKKKKSSKEETTHQTPHAADDKPVGNPGGDRTDADESRERRSRIRSSHDVVFFLLLKIVFQMVRPFPNSKFLHFSKRYDDDAKRDDDARWWWCAKRSFSVSRSLCLLEEDFESIDSFLSSSVYQREF